MTVSERIDVAGEATSSATAASWPAGRVHEVDDRADDRRGRRAAALLDQRVEVVLGAQRGGHPGVLLEQAEADDPPVAAAGRQLVRVHGEVRPVEAADADVDDARREPPAVVSGDRDPAARDLGEVRLAEADAR